jgi:ribose transport system permease protein
MRRFTCPGHGHDFRDQQRGIDLSIGSIRGAVRDHHGLSIKQYGFSVYIAVSDRDHAWRGDGADQRLIITRFNVPDLIGTLAMDLVYSRFRARAGQRPGAGALSGIPHRNRPRADPRICADPGLIGVATMLGGYVLLRRTYFGTLFHCDRLKSRCGGDDRDRVKRHKVYAYVLCGACAALAGVMLTGKLNAIQATSAPYFNLHVIAAVVVAARRCSAAAPRCSARSPAFCL